MGCHIHTQNKPVIKVPSARVNYEYQKHANLHNVIIPEKDLKDINYSMTGKFREYYCILNLEQEDIGYKINLNVVGEEEKESTIYLQPWPTKTNKQIVTFTQISDKYNKENKKKYSRDVHLQRYII